MQTAVTRRFDTRSSEPTAAQFETLSDCFRYSEIQQVMDEKKQIKKPIHLERNQSAKVLQKLVK
jgi:hypothetical protein